SCAHGPARPHNCRAAPATGAAIAGHTTPNAGQANPVGSASRTAYAPSPATRNASAMNTPSAGVAPATASVHTRQRSDFPCQDSRGLELNPKLKVSLARLIAAANQQLAERVSIRLTLGESDIEPASRGARVPVSWLRGRDI